jgi:hypothetical protein
MTSRRLGRDGAARLAAAGSVDDAVDLLAASTYGHDVRSGQALVEAQRAVVNTVLWNLRVLAGWAPREGVSMLRALVSWLEVSNTVDLLHAMAGRPAPVAYPLGSLATAWTRISGCSDPSALRDVLTSSLWRDPGADGPRDVGLVMQAVAADRLLAVVPEAEAWVSGGVGLLLARDLTSGRAPLPEAGRVAAARVVGWPALGARDLTELTQSLPRTAQWALAEVATADDLWLAEAHWWRRVDRDSHGMSRRSTPGRAALVGAVGMLAADAWRVRAALGLAARGGIQGGDADAVA